MNINQSKSRSVRQKQSQSVPSHGGPLLSRYVTTPPPSPTTQLQELTTTKKLHYTQARPFSSAFSKPFGSPLIVRSAPAYSFGKAKTSNDNTVVSPGERNRIVCVCVCVCVGSVAYFHVCVPYVSVLFWLCSQASAHTKHHRPHLQRHKRSNIPRKGGHRHRAME